MDKEGEKINRIEEMKTRLFSKNYKTEIEHRDGFAHHNRLDVPDSWAKEEVVASKGDKFFMKTSLFKKFFIFSIVFFVLALSYVFYSSIFKGNTISNDHIDIAILGNAFTSGGEELPLQVEITNRNSLPLDLVDLVTEYPKSSTGDLSQGTEHFRQSLGTIPAGAVRSENIKVTLFGEQGSVRPIKFSIEYRVEGSNAIFVKDKIYEVSVNSTPIDLSIDAPNSVSPNQDINLKIKAALNATKATSNILLKVDYPAGFQFTSATPAPTLGNNVWSLGDLAPGTARDIAITGKLVDVFDGEDKTFRVWSGSQSQTDKSIIGVVFNSLGHTVSIKKPFIEAQLYINGVYQREYAIDTKTIMQGEIRWKNNLDTKINDLSIVAKISGTAFNKKSININQGVYNSLANTITWDKSTTSNFTAVNPGEYGSVSFSLSPLSLFSSLGVIPDPAISIDVSITGRQPLEGYATKNLDNSESKTIKIISDVGFANKLLYYSGRFSNTGPIPPKAEKETTYTVVWTLSNTSNNISKAQVKSTLPPWVRFVGPILPPGEDVTYNPSTKEILWNIGNLAKGTGITTAGREVSFQLSFLPSVSQIGTAPVLVNDAILTGHDDFANVDIRVNKSSLNSRLTNDPAFPASGDRVIE